MAKELLSSEGLAYWIKRWEDGMFTYHKPFVHPMLIKHVSKLTPDDRPNKIFIPLCGKSLDIKWLADQGFSVVGLEGARTGVEQFFTEQNLEWTEEDAAHTGDNGKLFRTKDDRIKLFCSDILNFTPEAAGTFDAIWDRGSCGSIAREFVQRYVQVIESILKPKGRILLEVYQFKVDEMQNPNFPSVPPPHPVFEKDVRALFEPKFTVELIDKDDTIRLYGKLCECTVIYLLEKKA